jgi:excisionase family DNA binding protein
MSDGQLPKLLTPEQAARAIGLRKQHLLQLAREGIIPSVRLGRLVRFNRDALLEFFNNGGKAFEGGWRRERAS